MAKTIAFKSLEGDLLYERKGFSQFQAIKTKLAYSRVVAFYSTFAY